MGTKHTQGNWYFEKHSDESEYIGNITVDLGHPNIRTVACILDYAGKEESIANGEFICKAVNGYDALQEENKRLKDALQKLIDTSIKTTSNLSGFDGANELDNVIDFAANVLKYDISSIQVKQ